MHSAYVYSYPHKLAYGPLDPPVELAPLWQREPRQQLFLYWHIPFCEMRCGFCNLFTSIERKAEPMAEYLQALRRQANQLATIVSPCQVSGLAIGGGTPTQLPSDQLESLLDGILQWPRQLGGDFSVESSPATATPEKLFLLRQAGVTRLSLGVQSFVEAEVQAVHRRQRNSLVNQALSNIRGQGFEVVNIDLMVGLPGQTVSSLRRSLQSALDWQPEELYLYPLYVRPLTRLYGEHNGCDDGDLYRSGRDFLQEHGYEQVSLRMFRRRGGPGGCEYADPQRPMLGLGCGARSYTRELHYSTPYAVGSSGVRRILRAYKDTQDFGQAHFGYRLDEEERRRRIAVLSLLSEQGLDISAFPEFLSLLQPGEAEGGRLTSLGLERADQIGPRFFSARVQQAVLAGARE
ncbi:STM4012 family radical SAM protein [bacterium]|nr:STM4012 family radical SAM protein [bacterium]